MRILLVAVLSLAVYPAPAVEAACKGPNCAVHAKRKLQPPRPSLRAQIRPVRPVPLRPYDGDQGGSFRPSFGCNVMGCD